MREIKFRAWDKERLQFVPLETIFFTTDPETLTGKLPDTPRIELTEYVGLKDKNGKEIYELMELNHRYKVIYIPPSFVLYDISTGDIMEYEKHNKYEITGEYSPIQENEKGSIDQYISQAKGEE